MSPTHNFQLACGVDSPDALLAAARSLAESLERLGASDAELCIARGVAWTLVDLLAAPRPER